MENENTPHTRLIGYSKDTALPDAGAMRDQGYMPYVIPFISHEYQKRVRLYPECHDNMTSYLVNRLLLPWRGLFFSQPCVQGREGCS